jgi:hypothetical protein
LLIEKDRPLTRFETILVTVESVQTLARIIALVAVVLFLLQATIRYGAKTFWYLGQVLGKTYAQLTLVLLVLILAALVFALKEQRQGLYGLTEIVFGAGSAVNIALSMVPGGSALPQWLGLVGCAYIIVQGLGNASEALDRNTMARRGTEKSAAPAPAPSTS